MPINSSCAICEKLDGKPNHECEIFPLIDSIHKCFNNEIYCMVYPYKGLIQVYSNDRILIGKMDFRYNIETNSYGPNDPYPPDYVRWELLKKFSIFFENGKKDECPLGLIKSIRSQLNSIFCLSDINFLQDGVFKEKNRMYKKLDAHGIYIND